MTGQQVALVVAGLAVLLGALGCAGWLLRRGIASRAARAREQFREGREALADSFLRAAQGTGKPRGLRWASAELSGEFELARDRRTGRLHALAAAVIGFEAVEGGDMEGLPAVGLPRHATAVFIYEGARWVPTGRVVMNLSPGEVLRHFAAEFESLPGSEA